MNDKKNSEHYDDFTAWQAIENIEREKRAKKLISVLLYIIHISGFDVSDGIRIRDKKTGDEYKWCSKNGYES